MEAERGTDSEKQEKEKKSNKEDMKQSEALKDVPSIQV